MKLLGKKKEYLLESQKKEDHSKDFKTQIDKFDYIKNEILCMANCIKKKFKMLGENVVKIFASHITIGLFS